MVTPREFADRTERLEYCETCQSSYLIHEYDRRGCPMCAMPNPSETPMTAEDNKPKGPFTLWLDYGCEGWQPRDFPTIAEALESEKYCTNWVITEPVHYEVRALKDKD